MTPRKPLVLFATLLLAASNAKAAPEPLAIEAYLGQIREGNIALRSALETSSGAARRSAEASLLLAPNVFATAAVTNDQKPTSTAALSGDKTVIDSFSAGVSQQTTFGLSAKFSYQLAYSEISGASPLYLPTPRFYDAKPTLEINQSLWRNGFGREVRGTQTLLRSQAMATSHAEQFKAKAVIAEAEIAYWRLSAARRAVAIQKENIGRGERMLEWSARRVQLQLADRSDLMQAEASLQARRLELAQAQDEELAAARSFNTLRGVDSDSVAEGLSEIDVKKAEPLSNFARMSAREDLLAAEAGQTAAIANANVALERNSPTFDVFASVVLGGRDAAFTETANQSFSLNHPTYSAGLKFTVPFDLGTLRETRAGFTAEKRAAEALVERKRFEQEREWNDLTKRYAEAGKRLEIAKKLEELQKTKFLYERDRQSRGRSTVFQTLAFEQEYAGAQLNYLRAQTEILRLQSQLKTFAPLAQNEPKDGAQE